MATCSLGLCDGAQLLRSARCNALAVTPLDGSRPRPSDTPRSRGECSPGPVFRFRRRLPGPQLGKPRARLRMIGVDAKNPLVLLPRFGYPVHKEQSIP